MTKFFAERFTDETVLNIFPSLDHCQSSFPFSTLMTEVAMI